MYKEIGRMLLRLRKQADIQQKDLARGIMGATELSRVEKGNKEIDRMHLEALFQRLGKSVDKLELAMSMDEYQLFAPRFDILEALSVKNLEKAEDSIKKYETYIDKSKPLHQQALLLLKAVKSYIENQDIEKDSALFERHWKSHFLNGRKRNSKMSAYARRKFNYFLQFYILIYMWTVFPKRIFLKYLKKKIMPLLCCKKYMITSITNIRTKRNVLKCIRSVHGFGHRCVFCAVT